MLSFITRFIRAFFLIFLLLVTTPTLIFLSKWYYENVFLKKTYIGVIELPYKIENSNEIISSAKALFSSSDIRGVLIKCNGIGGNEGACQSIYYDLMRLKKIYKKPLISYCERECLYGSYLISLAADSIIASPGSLIGYLGAFEKNSISNSEYACISELKKNFEDQYFDIIINVRKNLNLELIKTLINKCFNGEMAKTANLVDIIGGSLEVENALRSKTVIEGSIEEIHGSVVEHFIMYAVDLISRIKNNFRK